MYKLVDDKDLLTIIFLVGEIIIVSFRLFKVLDRHFLGLNIHLFFELGVIGVIRL